MFNSLGHTPFVYKSQLFTLLCSFSSCVFASFNNTENEQTQRFSASNEKSEGHASEDDTELDSKVSKTLDTLKRLDEALAQNSNDPPLDGGEKMKEMVREYNHACSDLVLLCKKDKLRVLDAASDMIEPGGPKFLDVEINKGEMKRNFKWDEDSVDEFINLTKKTFSCWKKLWTLYNNFP